MALDLSRASCTRPIQLYSFIQPSLTGAYCHIGATYIPSIAIPYATLIFYAIYLHHLILNFNLASRLPTYSIGDLPMQHIMLRKSRAGIMPRSPGLSKKKHFALDCNISGSQSWYVRRSNRIPTLY